MERSTSSITAGWVLPTSTGPSMWDCITNAYLHGVRVGLRGVRDVREDVLCTAYFNGTIHVGLYHKCLFTCKVGVR